METQRVHSVTRSALQLLAASALTAGAAAAGATQSAGRSRLWYRLLRKAPFNPPDQVFGPVWTGLYTLTAISGYRVLRAAPSPARSRALGLWGVQLGLNAAWSWLFFGRRRPRVALAELGALAGTLGAYALTARRVDRAAAWLTAPYLAWVGFAGVLNEEIVRRNNWAR